MVPRFKVGSRTGKLSGVRMLKNAAVVGHPALETLVFYEIRTI